MPATFFSAEEYHQRLQRLHGLMKEKALDVLLVTTPEDIFYLSGHHTQGYYTYQALVVPRQGEPRLVGRRGELVNAANNSWIDSFTPYDDTDDPVKITADVIRGLGGSGTVGAELQGWFLPPRAYLQLQSALSPQRLTDSGRLVGSLRVLKSAKELEYIKQAARYASVGMQAAVDAIGPGVYDHEVAGAILGSMMRAGCNYLAMDPFVAVGKRSGNMHSAWDNVKIERGDTVFLEIAGCCNRYHGALLRTVHVGPDVPAGVGQWAEISNKVVDTVVKACRPGAESGAVAAAVAEVPGIVEEYKKGRKRVGYSIGIAFPPDWGEGHLMDLKSGDARPLRAGMTFHVPFVMREPNKFGAGSSETILITDTGAAKLTDFPAKLFVKN